MLVLLLLLVVQMLVLVFQFVLINLYFFLLVSSLPSAESHPSKAQVKCIRLL